jgi:DNA helicase-2/ATP-dependent DNA helicase PcrA
VALVEGLRAAQVPYRVAAGDGILDHRAVRGVLAEWRGRPGRPLAAVVTDLQGLTAGSSDAADDVVEDPETDRERRGALNGLADLARTYERMDPAATTEGFLSWLQAGSGAEDPDRSAEAVTVCSFHRAKGLEWPAVWVIGLERGLVPIGHATTPDAIAEERRLLYVALTRAERDLHCSWAERRKFGGRSVPREPSPWLEAMARAGRGSGSASPELGAEGDGWRQHLAVDRQRLRDLRRRPTQLPDGAADVLEALCAWRAGTARAAAVPPHVLLHDVTLAALAAARPATMEDLVAVPGIGKVKATRYGAALLAVVGEHRASA